VYLLVIEEFLILKDVDIQRSNGYLDACDNIEATRKRAVMQKGATWIRPSKNDKEGIQSMIRASIASADEGTRIIPFTPELTELVGAPGVIRVRANGYMSACNIFADGKHKTIVNHAH
jgi:hypothetical protein